MPALSPTMTEGNLAKWLKKEGDKVKPGEVIAEIETDKATMEVESADSGVLAKILVPSQAQGVKVNALIAVLKEPNDKDSDVEALIKAHNESSAAPAVAAPVETKVAVGAPVSAPVSAPAPSATSSRVFATPLAKRMAQNENIDLNTIQGSGPRGRIIKDDVLRQISNPSGSRVGRIAEEYRLLPLTQMRKTIAKRLLESKQTVPHFYLSADCDITELLKAREYLNAKSPESKVSVNDFIIKAIAHALKKVPNANASWSENGIMMYNNIDICVAVATDDGLITPMVKNADQKSINAISKEIKDLAQRAKANQLKPEEFMGGSFTVSNLGMYGVTNFQAIINPPQACIMAVGMGEQRPVVKNGVIQISTIMTVSLSCDHRVVDGAVGAQLMKEFKAHIEQPVTMFI